jgi:hypothetical protein
VRPLLLLAVGFAFSFATCKGEETLPVVSADAGVPTDAGTPKCDWTDDQLRALVSFASGIYGSARMTCPTHCPSRLGCMGPAAITAALTGGGTPVYAQVEDGMLTLPLEPGAYTLCIDIRLDGNPACIAIDIAPGQVRRVDAEDSRAGTGTIEAKLLPR